ncbi:senescence-associated carboxylesterase 101-like [Dorcoceras hygrometricum]|uniref:Senescence-associated carboxylesterase 101-like n=1 Tax=Dorcoceras hygrometricum TaxID=472368 RepID=A0A2Z7A5J2_9LAMI|nr:senescence-associated carboxylesterase 101-like [Dorcoceras hygrometricum]
MRSVVASHGPGSNPRGNAICNAILLQSFPVLQIFGLQYLDRHCPPSSDVLPLNLAQKLKISKSIKTGPGIAYRPETSRATRDRPEPNPRRNQTSRHDIAGDSPERLPTGGRHTKIACGSDRMHAASNATLAVRLRAATRPARSMAAQRVRDVQPMSGSSVPSSEKRLHDERPCKCRPWRAAVEKGGTRVGNKAREAATSDRARRRMAACFQRLRCATVCAHRLPRPCNIAVDNRQSGPRPEPRLLLQAALETLTNSARTDSPRRVGWKTNFRRRRRRTAGGGGGVWRREEGAAVLSARNPGAKRPFCPSTAGNPGIQPAVGPQPLWLRNHNSGLAQRIMVKRLATSPHDPLGITDSACKNQLVVVSVQYGPFNPYIPIRSTTIGKSRVAIDPIAMHTSWRSNSDIGECN